MLDHLDDRRGEFDIGLNGKTRGFSLQQARDALVTKGERLEGLASIGGLEGRLQGGADRHPRQKLERIQEIALPRPIRTEQDDERLEIDLDIDQ